MSDFLIRTARASDAPAIAKLAGQLGYALTPDVVATRLASLATSKLDRISVATGENDSVHGWIHVYGAERLLAEPFAEIGGLVVHEGLRGRGIGSALLEQATAWAVLKGYAKLRIRSNVVRTQARDFYERLGFELNKVQNVFERVIA